MSKKSDKFLPTPSASMMTEQDFAQAKFHSKTRPKYRDAGFSTLLPTPRSSPNENRQTKRKPSQEQSQHGLCLSAEIASCSPPDSPASPSPVQGEERARQTTATSGHRLLQLLRLSDPIGCCLRMLLESSIWYSPTVRLQWQTKPLFAKYRMTKSQIMTPSQEELTETSEKQGMRLFGLLYQLAVSGHPTDETGCGLLPTVESWDAQRGAAREYNRKSKNQKDRNLVTLIAKGMLRTPSQQEPGVTVERLQPKEGEPAKIGERAYDKKTGRLAQVGLTQQIGMLPTPRANKNTPQEREDFTPCLAARIAMLPTPASRDYKGANPENPYDCLDSLIETGATKDQVGKKTGMKLQPAFVEWMMGFPIGWTDLNPSETP